MKRPLRTLVVTATLTLPLGCGEDITPAGELEPPQTQALAAPQLSQIGVFRDGFWILDTDRNQEWSGDQFDVVTQFGRAGDKPFVVRSADCSGNNPYADIGVVRGLTWHLTQDNLTWEPSDPDFHFTNESGAIPLSMPDGRLVAFKDGSWFHDKNGSGTLDGGDPIYAHGGPGDVPLIATLKPNIGLVLIAFNPGDQTWHLDMGTFGDSRGLAFFRFGAPGDIPVTGNFNTALQGDEIAVFRPSEGKWYVDFNNNLQWDGNSGGDQTWKFGSPGDIPVVGTWLGNRCP